jgi:hypothetical protein
VRGEGRDVVVGSLSSLLCCVGGGLGACAARAS